MGVALYIVLNKYVDFDNATNGKSIAKELEQLVLFCKKILIQ